MATRLILFLLIAAPCFAQISVVNISGLPDKTVNMEVFYAECKAVIDSVAKLQDVYFAKNKRYFQGLASMQDAKAIESVTLTRFNRDTKPGDQKETWAEFGLRDISTRGQYRLDVYDGP